MVTTNNAKKLNEKNQNLNKMFKNPLAHMENSDKYIGYTTILLHQLTFYLSDNI